MEKALIHRLEDGESAIHRGDIDSAMHEYRSILDNDPKNVDALLGLAYSYFSRYEIERGREYLEEAQKIDPENPLVMYKLGYLHESLDDYETAQSYYEKAHSRDKSNPEINAAIERIQYLHDGEAMKLSDGTFIGDHSYFKPRKWRLHILSGASDLMRTMKHFYEHVGQKYEPTFLHNFMAFSKEHALFLLIVGFILTGIQAGTFTAILGVVLIGASTIVAILSFLSRFKLRKFMKDVRQHFLDETGYQIADPDRGVLELCKVTHKTGLLTMIITFLVTRWAFFDKEVVLEIWDRIDLPKPAWWQFKKKKKLTSTKNIKNIVHEALNRHWMFHLRNSASLPNWMNSRWNDNNMYIRHLLQGEDADDFDFKPIDNTPFLVKVFKLPLKLIALPISMMVFVIGLFFAATVVFAPMGERLMLEIAPAVMHIRKPTRTKGVEAIPVKDGLVIRSELQPMESLT
jgi:Tetratricopeptide repeat